MALIWHAELLGGIAGAGLVATLTSDGGIEQTITTLSPGLRLGQGTPNFSNSIPEFVLLIC